MGSFTKTDNKNLEFKLQLRRRVLDEAELGALHVLDLCAGEGHIWHGMRAAHIKVAQYLPVDRAPRMTGTLRGDVHEERFLEGLPFAQYNVIDVDTYGEPWKPWRFLFERLTRKTAVFLTHGSISSPGGSNISNFVLERLGIPLDWNVPDKRALTLFAARYLLLGPSPKARIVKGWKISFPNVTYYGLICEPRKEKPNHV